MSMVVVCAEFQLVPATSWRDPKELLEDEDDALKDLPFYRSITLPKGVKSIKEKTEEKRKENERLFGKITDRSHSQAKKRGSCTYAKGRAAARRGALGKVNGGDLSDDGSDDDVPTPAGMNGEEEDGDDSDDDDEENEADSSEEVGNEKDDVEETSSTLSVSNEDDSQGFSRKRKHSPDEDAMSTMPPKKRRYVEDQPSPCSEGSRKALRPFKLNRRFPRMPVKNRRMRKVSFFDCSYWQK